MRKKYEVTITEMVVYHLVVDATSEQDAKETAVNEAKFIDIEYQETLNVTVEDYHENQS